MITHFLDSQQTWDCPHQDRRERHGDLTTASDIFHTNITLQGGPLLVVNGVWSYNSKSRGYNPSYPIYKAVYRGLQLYSYYGGHLVIIYILANVFLVGETKKPAQTNYMNLNLA